MTSELVHSFRYPPGLVGHQDTGDGLATAGSGSGTSLLISSSVQLMRRVRSQGPSMVMGARGRAGRGVYSGRTCSMVCSGLRPKAASATGAGSVGGGGEEALSWSNVGEDELEEGAGWKVGRGMAGML